MTTDRTERGVLSTHDLNRPGVRGTLGAGRVIVLLALLTACVGPVLWLGKAAVSTTKDTLREPFALWPSGVAWSNLGEAWSTVRIGKYLANTFWVAGGSSLLTLVVALTGAYALSVLRPRYAAVLNAAVLATLFVPTVVVLVPLYLTVLDVPLLGTNLLNSYWAVWLPAAANSFIVLVVKRFFDQLPRELFEVAKVDGAGPYRILWHIVLPMSKPVVGVAALLTFVTGWKEFLWPMLVLPDAEKQPLSVALPRLSETAELSLLMAGLFMSVIIPMVLFLLFQRQFLRAAGQSGALKG
ncbi:carbohydrate ABC transporter permease [Streptomyces boninensis]|uniref:carbohydrate ABC transporter permease n=1 Tax=Streptomyces boninensis TaxID=2039455 RepID=UPI003B228065